MQPNGPLVPLGNSDDHPIAICIGFNAVQNRHDINVMIGNFVTRKDAEAFAGRLAELFEKSGVVSKGSYVT